MISILEGALVTTFEIIPAFFRALSKHGSSGLSSQAIRAELGKNRWFDFVISGVVLAVLIFGLYLALGPAAGDLPA